MSSLWILLLAVLAVNLVIFGINRALTPKCAVCDECATCVECPTIVPCPDPSTQVRAISPNGTYIADGASMSKTAPKLAMAFNINPGDKLEGTLFIINAGTNIFALAFKTVEVAATETTPAATTSSIIYYRGTTLTGDGAPAPHRSEQQFSAVVAPLLLTGWHTVTFSINVPDKTYTIQLDTTQPITGSDAEMPATPFAGATQIYIGGSRNLSGVMKFGSMPGSFKNFKINDVLVTSLEFASIRVI